MTLIDLVLMSVNYEVEPKTTPQLVARALSLVIGDLEYSEGPAKTPLSYLRPDFREGRTMSRGVFKEMTLAEDASPASRRGGEEMYFELETCADLRYLPPPARQIMYVEWPRKSVTQQSSLASRNILYAAA